MIVDSIITGTESLDKEFEEAKSSSLIFDTAFLDKNNKKTMFARLRTYNHLNNDEPVSPQELTKMVISLCMSILNDPAYADLPDDCKQIILAPIEKYEAFIEEIVKKHDNKKN